MNSSEIQHFFIQAVQKAYEISPESVQLEQPSNSEFGDLSCNIAMILSKQLQKNPREVAQGIIDAFPETAFVEKIEIAGPGFINLWMNSHWYSEQFTELNQKIEQSTWGKPSIGKGIKVITDSSHPNVAKPMGVHHLLSTIIGQSINHLYKACQYELVKDNYLGDWGTQFGKLIYAIQEWGDQEVIKKDPIAELLKLYVHFHEEAEKNPELEDKARAEFKKLEDGDSHNRALWQEIVDESLEEFQKLWNRLGVEFDSIHGESFYEDKMPEILKEGQEKGIIVPGEGGSLIIHMDDENMPPCILQKSDGATTYATRDLARIKYWQNVVKAEQGVVIVDVAQKLHFDQVHESAHKLGLTNIQHQAIHFGRMSFPDGSMSTRKGKVVLLEDVLDEAEKRALQKIKDHNSELPEDEQQELARKIGIGAVKYNILSQNRNKNYTFDWDVMLSFDGNSAPYLQYAYTRTQSLLKKAPERKQEVNAELTTPEEKALLKKLLEFEQSIVRSLEEFRPNLLCTYLFELSQSFSQFYNNVHILNSEDQNEQQIRLKLVEAVAKTLEDGLALLGIEVPERM